MLSSIWAFIWEVNFSLISSWIIISWDFENITSGEPLQIIHTILISEGWDLTKDEMPLVEVK